MSVSKDLEVSQQVHFKFEFYLVALTFTIAASAIQTGKFSGYSAIDFFEGAAWVTLVTSGLIGLWRLEYFAPMLRANWNLVNEAVPQPEAESQKAAFETSNRRKYKAQRLLFLAGIVSLLMARLLSAIHDAY